MYSIIPYGDNAVLINFEQDIREDIHRKILSLEKLLMASPGEKIRYCIPAYCSLTVLYDPEKIDYKSFIKLIEKKILEAKEDKEASRTVNLPVSYDPSFALDTDEVSIQTGLSKEEIIANHSSKTYRVYMLGFLPGFPYMGKTADKLYCKRKKAPRLKVPERSVGLAGSQTGIYPLPSPGGWQIIGKCPLELVNCNEEIEFLFSPGDQVNFIPVSKAEYESIRNEVIDNKFKYETIYEE